MIRKFFYWALGLPDVPKHCSECLKIGLLGDQGSIVRYYPIHFVLTDHIIAEEALQIFAKHCKHMKPVTKYGKDYLKG